MLANNPRAVVTGAASGLGRAIALQLGARGGHVVVCDIDLGGAETTKQLVAAAGGRAHVERCDVAVASDVEHLRDRALAVLGGVDLVVNNAGVAVAGAIGTVPLANWEWIVGINLMGVVHGCHFFVPVLQAQGAGHVLNVASIAGITFPPQMGPYCATKAAVVALTECLAGEVQGTGVGATVLCPYFFATGLHQTARVDSARISAKQLGSLMKKSKVQADEVARRALQACDRNELYCFPHTEAKVLQLLKRLSPRAVPVLLPRLEQLAKLWRPRTRPSSR